MKVPRATPTVRVN